MKNQLHLLRTIPWVATITFLLFTTCAEAAVTCNISSAVGIVTAYGITNPNTNITPGQFDVTCTRDGAPAGGPTVNVSFFVAASSTAWTASFSGSTINYTLAQDSACTVPWDAANLYPAGGVKTVIPMAKNTTTTVSYQFWGCIPALQPAGPQGTYSDTVTLSFSGGTPGAATFINGTMPISIYAPATCTLAMSSMPPAPLAFTYTAFSPTAVNANTQIDMTCTQYLPYTIALDATVDVVSGLNYTLGLNTAAGPPDGASPLSSVGNGAQQTFFVNGTMAAGQAGTCSGGTCSATQVRTLTITY